MNDSFAGPRGHSAACRSDDQGEWVLLAQKCRYRRELLARLLQVSLRTLDRYFKKHLSTTVGTWLRELQLADAYQQIKAGKPVKETAFEVGFKQPSHFTRRFKHRFGFLPSMLRGTPQEVLRARLHEAATAHTMTLAWGGGLHGSSGETLPSRGRLFPTVQVFGE